MGTYPEPPTERRGPPVLQFADPPEIPGIETRQKRAVVIRRNRPELRRHALLEYVSSYPGDASLTAPYGYANRLDACRVRKKCVRRIRRFILELIGESVVRIRVVA
jgi:hypothetical protein